MLHDKQRNQIDRIAILDYIERYEAEHRRSPSQRHIARALQLSAASRANYAVKRLTEAGLLQVEPIERGLALRLIITETGTSELARWRSRQQVLKQRSRRGAA